MQNKSTQEFDDIIRNIIENQKVQEMKKGTTKENTIEISKINEKIQTAL